MENPKYVFFDGEFVEWNNAKIHVTCHALHYGTAVFAGLRGYYSDSQMYIFRIRDHFERLHNSCRIMLIELKYSIDELVDVTKELIRKNKFNSDIYIRPLAFKNESPKKVGINIQGVSSSFTIFALPFGEYLDVRKGLKVCTSTWRRINDNTMPARAKVSGGYVNSALAKAEAMMNGFDDAIMLTQDGFVSEGTAMNLFIVRDGVLITPPVYADILEGINRKSILEFAKDLGYKTEVRPVQKTELYICDEAFFCGTGAQVAPIFSFDHRPIKNQEMPITKEIQKTYFEIVRGKNEKYKKWLTEVY